jgi:cytochrome P450
MSTQTQALTLPTPPMPRFKGSSWVWGSADDFAADALGTLMQAHREHGDTVASRFGPIPVVMVSNPADVQRMLVDNRANYTKRTYPYSILRLLLGNGLVTSEGSHWLRQRRIAQPAFHKDRMHALSPMITQMAQDLATTWETAASRHEVRDILNDMTLVTLRIAGHALISQDLGGQAGEVGSALTDAQRYVDHRLNSPLSLPLWVPTARGRTFRQARKMLFGLVNDVIARRRAAGGAGDDMLSMMMNAKDPETGESMSDVQLADEVLTTLMAGHETTSNMLAWTFYRLSLHPDVMRRVQEELRTVLAGRAPTLADLPRLTYLDAVLKESLRLHPAVWILDRYAEADDVLGGFKVRKGTTVISSPWVTHRHPALWKNPEGFDPDRWFTPEVKSLHRLAYFPFSSGQRKCIGDTLALLEAPLIMATLLQRFSPTLEPGHPVVPETLVTLRPKFGMRMAIERSPHAAALPLAAAPAAVASGKNAEAAAAGCPFHAAAP